MEPGGITTGYPQLDFISLSSDITATQDLELPAWKGSLLRGLLGTFLKQMVCVFHGAPCGPCPLLTAPSSAQSPGFLGCAFPLFFGEAKGNEAPVSGTSRLTSGSPFVLDVQCDGRRRYQMGEGFRLNLRLFGPAIPWAFHVINAVQEGLASRHLVLGDVVEDVIEVDESCAGAIALRDRPGAGGRSSRVVFGCDGKWLTPTVRTLSLSPLFFDSAALTSVLDTPFVDVIDSVRMDFTTPLRVKDRNTLTDTMSFSVIIRAALRRLTAAFACWGSGAPLRMSEELVRVSHSVPILEQCLAWQDMVRKSSRQRSLMRLGGVIGHVVYGRVPAVLVHLLQQVSPLHIGKQTSFGLGAIKITHGVEA